MTRSKSSREPVVSMPPSPATPRFLSGNRLNAAAAPIEPTTRPPIAAPTAWAASSMIGRLRRAAIAPTASRSAGLPVRCTGMIARVRGVMASASREGSIRYSALTSTNTGVAPVITMAPAVATKLLGTVITSSPAPTPRAFRAKNSASVPELRPTAWAAPQARAKRASNWATWGPSTNWHRLNSSSTRAVTVPSSNWRGRSMYLTIILSTFRADTSRSGSASWRNRSSGAPVKRGDAGDHELDLVATQVLVHRQRDDALGLPLRRREVALLVAEAPARRLEVQRHRVVDLGLDLALE